MRAVLFHNATAGGGKFDKQELTTALRLGGLKPFYSPTRGRRFAAALRRPADLVVIAGGDGTVAKVISQMPDRRVPVAILPLGSANNIARSFGIAGAPYELAETLHPLYFDRLRIGVVRGPWGRRHFVEAIGFGPLARMMQSPALDRASGVDSLQGGRDALRKIMRKAKPLDIDVRIDGRRLKGPFLALEIMNIPYTGPGLPLAPAADPGDRLLDVVYVQREEDRPAMMAWIRKPQHRRPPMALQRGRTIEVAWRRGPMRIDDDPIEAPGRPARVVVALQPAAAKILVPPPRGIRRLWNE